MMEEKGNISALARRLQVSSKTVYRWLRAHRLDPDRLRAAA
jgi:transposase-like protein